ncbi:MAG: CDP-alcohol phosphatidyltransferase family protein [Candidatus Sumerlaeia bacterium]
MDKRKARFVFVTSLTLSRIPLILVFLAVNIFCLRMVDDGLVLGNRAWHAFWFWIAFGGMVSSALTDLFDGYFARKFKVETRLGAYADPMTDKTFYLVTFPTLLYLSALQGDLLHSSLLLGLAALFLFRDQWVSFLRSLGAIYNISGKANWSGKARTLISFPSICIIYWYLMAPDAIQFFAPWFIYAVEGISCAINIISIYVYTGRYWSCFKSDLMEFESKAEEDEQ